ncbi:hypothetical protein O6H91_08G069700 [Diphasiastrum complanatum]|uniref:Uncharacterized protein n=1 Tax=Diphasiastrum complanatum TaxID=34168 RepID=A0ACC2CYZ7_DIPCM|nr:hypothetical protein O6H91_08G069700 [Diphasiastrum complanatum]
MNCRKQQLAVDNKFMEENIALVLFPPDIVGYAYTCYHKLLSRRAKQLQRVFNHGGNIDVHLVTPWEHLPLSSGSSITVES